MLRLGIGVLTVAAALTALPSASIVSPARPAVAPALERTWPVPTDTLSPEARRPKRRARWTCAVRHARTGSYYRCTEGDEKKSCRCAIAKCKHWNPGQPQQCSRSCRCKKA